MDTHYLADLNSGQETFMYFLLLLLSVLFGVFEFLHYILAKQQMAYYGYKRKFVFSDFAVIVFVLSGIILSLLKLFTS